MEAVVNQALADVINLHIGGILEAAHVQDELVRACAVAATEHDVEVSLQTLRHVVGVQDCTARCLKEDKSGGVSHQGYRMWDMIIIFGDFNDSSTSMLRCWNL